ncbi:MAG: cation:dicarboxylase symporter family transporter [Rheinheimera sp.]|nr:cation:dicarboxylase symporter family transporter [Rheinheimera sp.]
MTTEQVLPKKSVWQFGLVPQIIVGILLGIALASISKEAGQAVAILGALFVKALKAIAPILVFVLVASAIANRKIGGQAKMKPVLVRLFIRHFLSCINRGRSKLYVPDNFDFDHRR